MRVIPSRAQKAPLSNKGRFSTFLDHGTYFLQDIRPGGVVLVGFVRQINYVGT